MTLIFLHDCKISKNYKIAKIKIKNDSPVEASICFESNCGYTKSNLIQRVSVGRKIFEKIIPNYLKKKLE